MKLNKFGTHPYTKEGVEYNRTAKKYLCVVKTVQNVLSAVKSFTNKQDALDYFIEYKGKKRKHIPIKKGKTKFVDCNDIFSFNSF